jgi:hypothetical protein
METDINEIKGKLTPILGKKAWGIEKGVLMNGRMKQILAGSGDSPNTIEKAIQRLSALTIQYF